MKRLWPLLLCLVLITPSLAEDALSLRIDAVSSETAFLVVDEDDEGESAADDIILTLGGDAVLGVREAWWKREDALPAYLNAYGMAHPFSGLQSLFATDDLTFINLECALKDTQEGEDTGKSFRFRGLPAYAEALNAGSVEVVNIANNHYIDYGEDGEAATRAALDDVDMPYSGYGYGYIWDCSGRRIGFAGCRETIFKEDQDIIAREAAALRRAGCDVIIYACHFGQEYTERHNTWQRVMAQAAANAGVDIVVGTHPHVVHGVGSVDDTAVLWSLGNLMFGGTLNLTTYDATLARVALHFNGDAYTGCTITMVPILTSSRASEGVNDYHPVIATGEDKARILRKIQYDSQIDVSKPMDFPAKQTR